MKLRPPMAPSVTSPQGGAAVGEWRGPVVKIERWSPAEVQKWLVEIGLANITGSSKGFHIVRIYCTNLR